MKLTLGPITEVLQFFLGLIRWCVDLMNFMADELFETANILKGRFNDVLLVNQTSKPANQKP